MCADPFSQLAPAAFEAALQASSEAAHAARQAVLAEMLLLWGGPMFALRTLPQVALSPLRAAFCPRYMTLSRRG